MTSSDLPVLSNHDRAIGSMRKFGYSAGLRAPARPEESPYNKGCTKSGGVDSGFRIRRTKPTPFLRPSPIRKTSALFGDSAEASRPGAGSSGVPPWLSCAPGPGCTIPPASRAIGRRGNEPLQQALGRSAPRYRERPRLDSVSPHRRHIHASGTTTAQELLKRDEISRVRDATEHAAGPQR